MLKSLDLKEGVEYVIKWGGGSKKETLRKNTRSKIL